MIIYEQTKTTTTTSCKTTFVYQKCNWYQFLSLRHFKYRLLKLFVDIAPFTSHGRLFHMAAPEYINDLRKSSQFGFGM